MTEKTSKPHTDYIPAMGKHFLLPLYDVVHHMFGLAPIHQEMITLAALQDGHRVLDVGCGTGNLLRSLGKRYRNAALTGLDPDPKALARAARKTRRAGLNIRLDEGFAQALPYPNASFDRVFSSLMLHHLDNESKNALLAEIRRVLRPNGQLVLADMMAEEHGHGHRLGRMHENVGDALSQRIAEAGFTVDPTRTMPLRTAGKIGIERARPTKD